MRARSTTGMPDDVFCRISRGEERAHFAYSDDGSL
jgi:hypothetical protein